MKTLNIIQIKHREWNKNKETQKHKNITMCMMLLCEI